MGYLCDKSGLTERAVDIELDTSIGQRGSSVIGESCAIRHDATQLVGRH